MHDDAVVSTTPREAARAAAAKVLAVAEFVGSDERWGGRSLTPEVIATSTTRPRPMPQIRIRRLMPPSRQAPDTRTRWVTLAALTTVCCSSGAMTRAHPHRGVEPASAIRFAVGPCGALIHGLDEEVAEHLVGVRHAGLSDALSGLVDDRGSGPAAKVLR